MGQIDHEHIKQNPCNLAIFLWKLKFSSVLALIHLSTWSPMEILLLFLSMSAWFFLFFFDKAVKLKDMPLFLLALPLLSIDMSQSLFKVRLFKSFKFCYSKLKRSRYCFSCIFVMQLTKISSFMWNSYISINRVKKKNIRSW